MGGMGGWGDGGRWEAWDGKGGQGGWRLYSHRCIVTEIGRLLQPCVPMGMAAQRPKDRSRIGCTHMVPPAPWPAVEWTELLSAVPDDDLALSLFAAFQRVTDWALSNLPDTDPRLGGREPREYRRYIVESPSLDDCLTSLARSTTRKDREGLVRTCLQLSAWGERNGYQLLALRFAEAAATCDPFDPVPASIAGRIARTAGLGERAEEWFRRGIALARERQWSASYVRAHLGLGTLLKERGLTDAALSLYQAAGWRAQRSGLKWLAGEVHHDMLLLALGLKAFKRAEEYADRALRSYPKHHARVPALVHDFALLCVREYVFDPALPLLQKVLPLIPKPNEKLIVWSTLTLAAAGAKVYDVHEGGRESVLEMAETYRSSAPPALMNLAFAAHIRNEWDAAAEYAKRALSLANGNSLYREQIHDAHALLALVETRTPAPAPRELPAYTPEGKVSLSTLVASCARLISRWHGPTYKAGAQQQAALGDFGPI